MLTKTINCEYCTNKAVEAVIDICTRMGWNSDMNGLLLTVNVPIVDEYVWDFIFAEFE